MITRQGFEHQKDINLEAYTLGLVQRVDINFRIDYKGGVLDSVSQLPVSWNTVNDAFFVRDNINNRVYIWDGAAWVVDQTSTGGGWVNYTTAPTTTGNRIVQSIGVNADLIEETLIEVDPITWDILFPSTIEVTFESNVNNVGNTITNDWTTTNNINGAVENWDATTVINNNWGTINNTWTTINNNWVTENYTNGSVVNYDNTTDVTYNWDVTFNGGIDISGGSVVVNVASDSANQTYNGTDATWVLPSTPMTLDVLHITTSSGTNLIRWVDYSLSGDTVTWIINPTNWEDLYAWWLTTGSLTTAGSNVAHIERFVSTPWQTVYTLANTPVSPAFIWVSNGSGQYVKQNASDDYTVSGNDVIFNVWQTAGTVITIQYIQSIVNTSNLVPMQKKTYTWAAGAWDSSVTFTDADILSDSIITGWTITSGTQVGFWEWDLSTPWSITINSTASETWNISFTYSYVI